MSDTVTLAVNNNNDIYLSGGTFATVNGIDAYKTILESVIRTVKGELKNEPDIGIPYFDTIFDSPSKINQWKTSVLIATVKFPFVNEIVSFDAEYVKATSTLNYEIEISTDLGNVQISGQINP